MLLYDGISPTIGAKLLDKATVDMMCTNQVGQFPDLASQDIPDAKSDLPNAVPEAYPVEGNPPRGWA